MEGRNRYHYTTNSVYSEICCESIQCGLRRWHLLGVTMNTRQKALIQKFLKPLHRQLHWSVLKNLTWIYCPGINLNKYFAVVLDHARLIFPTKIPMVTHKKVTTSCVNYCTVRWYPNKETRPRSARLFGPISVKNLNLMWRHAAHFTIRLRSSCSELQFSACFVPRYIRFASCHRNYCVLR